MRYDCISLCTLSNNIAGKKKSQLIIQPPSLSIRHRNHQCWIDRFTCLYWLSNIFSPVLLFSTVSRDYFGELDSDYYWLVSFSVFFFFFNCVGISFWFPRLIWLIFMLRSEYSMPWEIARRCSHLENSHRNVLKEILNQTFFSLRWFWL